MFDNNRVIDESNETYNHVKLFNSADKKVKTVHLAQCSGFRVSSVND